MNSSEEKNRKIVTISIPVLNERGNIGELLSRLDAVANAEDGYHFEFLFTDNASTDGTFEALLEQAQEDRRIRVLRFSRNFGFQKSILTNFLNARGAAAIQLDADMQDPPELIPQMLRKWEEGYLVVYGIRRGRKESFVMRAIRRQYYALVTALSETYVPANAGDFRLIDRTIISELARVQEQTPYLRGLIASMGFPQTGIVYDRDQRRAGTSKFGLLKLLTLGIDGVTSQSTKPLRLMTLFGVALSIFSVFLSFFYLFYWIILTDQAPSGFTTIVLMLLFLIGLNSFFLGVIGEYVGRIFNNTRGLPIAIIQDRIEPVREEYDKSQ